MRKFFGLWLVLFFLSNTEMRPFSTFGAACAKKRGGLRFVFIFKGTCDEPRAGRLAGFWDVYWPLLLPLALRVAGRSGHSTG